LTSVHFVTYPKVKENSKFLRRKVFAQILNRYEFSSWRRTNQTFGFIATCSGGKEGGIWLHSLVSFLFTQAIRSLKSEADWQEILKKVKEEEEESSVPTDLFKVKTQYE